MGFYDYCHCCHCSVPPNIDPIVLPLIFFSSCPLFRFFLSSKGIWCLVGKTWVATLHQARWDLFLKVWKSNLDLKSQARQLLNPCLSILLLFFRNCGVFFLSLGTIQVLRQKKGGWGRKMAIFADLQYYLCWRRWVGGPKKNKKKLRNTWMVSLLAARCCY